jgi:hypothetical protein
MGFGISIFLIAAGAITRWGVDRNHWGVWDLDAIGLIGMVIGVLGLLVSTIVWAPWRRRDVVETVTEPHVHVQR